MRFFDHPVALVLVTVAFTTVFLGYGFSGAGEM